MEKRWSGSKPLPSDVVEDSDFDSVLESRVPTLGLPHLPGNHAWGKQQQDSRCDSGVFDSFQSGASSIRSSYADGATTLDSVDETCLRDRLKSLSIQQQTPERLPSVDEDTTRELDVIRDLLAGNIEDEGYVGSRFSSTDLKDESISFNKPYNPNIVFPPELPKEEKEPEARVEHQGEDDDFIDDKILDIFLQDDEGDT